MLPLNCVSLIAARSLRRSHPEGSPIISLVSTYSCMSCHNICEQQYLAASCRSMQCSCICVQLCYGGRGSKNQSDLLSEEPSGTQKGSTLFLYGCPAVQSAFHFSGEFSRRRPPLRRMSRPLITRAQGDLPVNSPPASL